MQSVVIVDIMCTFILNHVYKFAWSGQFWASMTGQGNAYEGKGSFSESMSVSSTPLLLAQDHSLQDAPKTSPVLSFFLCGSEHGHSMAVKGHWSIRREIVRKRNLER